MARMMKFALLAVVCSALLLQSASAYSFSFGGGYGTGIYNSAQYYSSHGISQSQYRSDLSGALRHSGASAAAAASGFSSAMANALVGHDYNTYGYSCAGAIGYGSTGSWTNAFRNAKGRGFNSAAAAAATSATRGGRFGGDVGSATAAAASASGFGSAAAAAASGGGSAAAAASSSGKK